jgi:hypothetical protein
MDEKYIEYLYNSLGGQDKFGAYEDFKTGISTDEGFRKAFYDQIGEGSLGSYSEFEGGVKKKEDGSTSGPGDSSSKMSQAATGALGSRDLGPVNFLNPNAPTTQLNRRQQAEFTRAGGYVMSPDKASQLASSIYEKPDVSQTDRDKDRLIDIVGADFERKQDTERWLAQQRVQLQGGVFSPDQAARETAAQSATAIAQGGFGDAVSFVDEAIRNDDYKSLRDIVNNYYGSEQAKIKKDFITPGSFDQQAAKAAEISRTNPEFAEPTDQQIHSVYNTMKQQSYANVEEAEKKLAPLKQEQARTNLLIDQISSKKYSFTNPDVQQAYDQEPAGSKPLKDEISINQYSGLRYYQDNNPEMYAQMSLELGKAADPALFGKEKYDKNNAEYQYMQYLLDKKGSELNKMAINQHMQDVAPEKAQADMVFRSKLNELTQALNNATTYNDRKAIQDQINMTQSQYQLNPAVQQAGALMNDLSTADVNFNQKYPDYASRNREQMAKDLLQTDGLKWWEEVTSRVGWLGQNTLTGVANMAGLNELEFGQSRNYLRDLRKGEKQEFETYKPGETAAVQSLYRLNLNADDYQKINEIKDSELSKEEQLKAAADYLDANKNRIYYVENPAAGKTNWTWDAIGNQVADVGTQVIYQGALTYLTASAANAVLAPEAAAAIQTGAVADAGAAVTAESMFGPAANVAADLSATATGLKSKLINLGSVFGTTYATAYQPAYQSALQAGKNVEEAESYANQIAIVNALSETISPDIEVLKRSAAGVRGLATVISPENITLANRIKRGAGAFGKGYLHNVIPETAEEIAAAYGEYGVDALHNMNQDEMNSLNSRIRNATVSTVIGMVPFAGMAGISSVKNQSRMVREQFYQAGLYPDIMRAEVNSLIDNNSISQQEGDRRIQLISTMTNIIRDIPPRKDGSQMPDRAKVDYAFSRLKQAAAQNAFEGNSDPNAQTELQTQINEAAAEQQGILNGVEVPAGSGIEAAVPGAETKNVTENVKPYNPGDILVNHELGNFEVISEHNDVYNIRLPNGNTEDFSLQEIKNLIKPAEVTTPITPEQINQSSQDQSPAVTIEQGSQGEPQTAAITTTEPSPAEGGTAVEGAAVSQVAPEGQQEGPVATEGQGGRQGGITQQQTPSIQEITSPINPNQNATTEIQQPQGVLQQRPQGNESGETTEAGSSRSVQPTTGSPEEGQIATADEGEAVNDTAHLTVAEQQAIDKMPSDRLYSNILAIDPENPVRGRMNEYSREQLQGIYRGVLSDYSRTGGTAEPLAQPVANRATTEPIREVNRQYNSARDQVDRAREALGKVTDKNSTEYQEKKQAFDNAQAASAAAENRYIEAIKDQNKQLREQKRKGSLGISGENNAKADARIVANYIELARIYTRQGVASLKEFAGKLGEQINDYMRRAWELTAGNEAPTLTQGESYRDYLRRLREWEQQKLSTTQSREERRATQKEAQEMRTGARLLNSGIKILQENINTPREQFNQRLGLENAEYMTYVAALKSVIESNREDRTSAKEILNSLREAHPNEVITSEMDLLRMQLSAEQRGSRIGYKEGIREKTAEARASARQNVKERLTNVRNQVQQVLDDMFNSGLLKSGTFSEGEMEEMASMINHISTEKQINTLKSFFQRLLTNSSEARTVNDIQNLQRKLSKIIRNKDVITANLKRKNPVIGNKSLLRALKNLNPLKVSQPLRLNAILDNVVNSLAGTAVLEYTNDQIQDFITTQTAGQLVSDAQDLKGRYAQTLNVMEALDPNFNPDQVLNQQEFDGMVDNISNDPGLNADQKTAELNNLYTAVQAYENEIESGSGIDPNTGDVAAQLTDIYQEIKQGVPKQPTTAVRDAMIQVIGRDQDFLEMALKAPDFVATDEQREWADQITNLDPSRLQPKQLALLKNVMDNIFINGDFSGAQYFSAVYESQQNVDSFTGWADGQVQNLKTSSFSPDGLLAGWIGQAAQDISSSDQVILTIANNSRDYAVNLMKVTSLGDIKANHAQTQQILDKEVNQPLSEIRSKYKKEGIQKAESVYKRGMYAYLNENNFGNELEQQHEFERRKALVDQDIRIKEQLGVDGDKEVREEAAILRKIYDDNFSNITTQQQLQQKSILSEGEKAIYDLFRNFYDKHQDAFRDVMETLLNQPFHEVNNYVKDSYRILETGLADADFREIDQSNFYNERDQSAPSTATMQRNTFNDLDNIAIRDMEGNVVSRRGLNFNFDLSQLNNSKAMMEDIYTLKDRIKAKMVLNDPALRENIGASNQRLLAKTIKQQVQQSMGLLAHPEQSQVAAWAANAASTMNKIGVRQVLYSVGQLPKQQIDIITNTNVNLGTDFYLYWQAWNTYGLGKNEEIDSLLKQSEIGVRGKNVGGTNWMTPTAQNQVQQLIGKMGKSAELDHADKLAKFTVEGADTYGARIAWLAYYMQSLKRQGLIESAKEVDWAKENRNINKEARDYAQLMTSTRLNINSQESQSTFYSKIAGWGRLFQVIFMPLSSFNMNNYAIMYRDINTLFTGDTKDQKLTAMRSIASRLSAELAFQITRGGISMLLKEGVKAVLSAAGIEPPKKKEDEFWKKVFSESVKNLMFGMMGNIVQDAIVSGIDWLSDKAFDTEIIQQYDKNPNSPANNFGMGSILYNSASNMYNYSRDLIGRTDPNGNPIELTIGQKTVLATAFVTNLMAMRGYMIGEAKQIADGAAREVNKKIQTDAKDPYWILMNNPDAKPQVKINGQQVKFNDEQLKYYQEQKSYHYNEIKDLPWTDKYKQTESTSRAKVDLYEKYGSSLEYESEDKK